MRYVGIHSEGGLVPYDLLDRIAREEKDIPGQKPPDFGLPKGRSLLDEISRIWSETLSLWEYFKKKKEDALGDRDPYGTTLTRESWMLRLLTDPGMLGYELEFQQAGVQAAGKPYPISHRAGRTEDSVPVDIEGFRIELDRKPPAGRLRTSPHSMLQNFLNNSERLWGVVTNGLHFRLLRNSARTSKPTFLEFDLEDILNGNRFNEFALFYRLCHCTRLPQPGEDPTKCLLETYFQQAIEEGGRVREHLRDGVEYALKVLGTGFLRHKDNHALREKISSGTLTPADFHRQLLRLVYRLLFLMVAEERKLIQAVGEAAEQRQAIYRDCYSVSRLRDRAERVITASEFSDVWLGLLETFALFSYGRDTNPLGIPPLNGDLFSDSAIPDLKDMRLYNHDLLVAIRHMSLFRQDNIVQKVNYSALDVEELGSVYESLLDNRPVIQHGDNGLEFTFEEGSERRSTGSYYTAPELVGELIDYALVPVLEEHLAEAENAATGKSLPEEKAIKEKVLLGITVCDPACGSGHFLLAAARRIGRELAKVRTGEDEPSPTDFHLAVRDAISHCLHGVDKNPLAVDLCKVALWLEGHWVGKPLTFLDHRIRCGDSLVGILDPEVMAHGIPEEAFDPVSSDDRSVASAFRKRNRQERKSWAQRGFTFDAEPHVHDYAKGSRSFAEVADDTAAAVRKKEEIYSSWRSGMQRAHDQAAADLWTAQFFQPLIAEENPEICTTADFLAFAKDSSKRPRQVAAAEALAQKYHFFHWFLEFPEVVEARGFNVVIGNPPFMGGKKLSTAFGEHYRKWLDTEFVPFINTADLCSAFYRRAFSLTRPAGRMGMVATNTISQGDTRESGLAVLVRNHGAITLAHRFIKWPGAANVEVNLLAIHKNDPSRAVDFSPILDGRTVPFISSRLDTEPEAEPRRLPQNEGKAFIGDFVRGLGFVLEPEEAEQLLAKDLRNGECLFPYLNGQDLNSHPEQSPSRFVICFHDWGLEQAELYPDLLQLVEKRVRPERDKLRGPGDRLHREHWWQFANYRPGMRKAIRSFRRVLVRSRVSELHALVFVPQGWIYNEQTVVFAFEDYSAFALLQSNVHEAWVWRNASSLESRNRYTPSDCFETFPLPANEAGLSNGAPQSGQRYYEHRQSICRSRQVGLTKVYNLFHDRGCADEDITRLRALHAEMDRAILNCYGWQDLNPGHDFHTNDRGQVRYTISPDCRRDLLRRLLALNQAQAASTSATTMAAPAH